MIGDVGFDDVAPQCTQPRQRTALIGAYKPGIAHHVGGQNGGEAADGHSESPASRRPSKRCSMSSRRVNTGFSPRNRLATKPGAKLLSTAISAWARAMSPARALQAT